ncbi:hypothetical protein A2U01_0050464 [Trifolium medium]|uniref:Uncharacterized protein n=1 Tax=Trifolium medium TaxID=97028 RepID=A0A392R131_9FABA|nr:hypothetical protein [Trifolium medium]
MTPAFAEKYNIGKIKVSSKMELVLADQSIINSYGMIEDVLVKIKDLVFPVDFVILDIQVDNEKEIILGRPFLGTCHACINMKPGELKIRINEEERTIRVYGKTDNHCYKVEVRDKDLEEASATTNVTRANE